MHTFKDHEITRDPSTQPITTKLPRFSACRSDILRHNRNQLALRTNGNRALTSLNTAIIFCDDTARTTNDHGKGLEVNSFSNNTHQREMTAQLFLARPMLDPGKPRSLYPVSVCGL